MSVRKRCDERGRAGGDPLRDLRPRARPQRFAALLVGELRGERRDLPLALLAERGDQRREPLARGDEDGEVLDEPGEDLVDDRAQSRDEPALGPGIDLRIGRGLGDRREQLAHRVRPLGEERAIEERRLEPDNLEPRELGLDRRRKVAIVQHEVEHHRHQLAGELLERMLPCAREVVDDGGEIPRAARGVGDRRALQLRELRDQALRRRRHHRPRVERPLGVGEQPRPVVAGRRRPVEQRTDDRADVER